MLQLSRIRLLDASRALHTTFAQNTAIRIVEVGPRDGLQNEPVNIPTEQKVEFINKLSETGLKTIEVTSFVSPKWVPQMGDNSEVFRQITKLPSVSYPVLVPNSQGLQSAINAGVKEIAVFASASEGFSRKNINCSVEDSLKRIKKVAEVATAHSLKIRGYVSCVVGCPYDGIVSPAMVARVSALLFQLGCYEISLGDTIGVGTKNAMNNMLQEVLKVATADKFAVHCHDTYGQALVNICTSLERGITVIDSAVSGLGGCPYAKGASGNVATEDLVYMLNGMGLETGVDLQKLILAGQFISSVLNKSSGSKVNQALFNKGLEQLY